MPGSIFYKRIAAQVFILLLPRINALKKAYKKAGINSGFLLYKIRFPT